MGTVTEEAEWFDGAARLFQNPVRTDSRGALIPFYFDQLPFSPRRCFGVTGVPVATIRGGHAHRTAVQLLVCLQGRIEVLMHYRGEEVTIVLDAPDQGLLLQAGVWCRQTYLDEGAVLLVFASEPFDPDSYIEERD